MSDSRILWRTNWMLAGLVIDAPLLKSSAAPKAEIVSSNLVGCRTCRVQPHRVLRGGGVHRRENVQERCH
jgi:hypothetical protein